jgi:hypothetical protein
MIKPEILFTLTNPFISAASGLVFHAEHFYVISDDELSLLSIGRNHKAVLHRLFPGFLPEGKERKGKKPDLESLVGIGNELLALPSGSELNRVYGVLLNLENFSTRQIDFSPVMDDLRNDFSELNIEGSVVLGDRIRLFQRGNGKLHENGIIDLDLHSFLKGQVQNKKVKRLSLGTFLDTPLSFTDASLHDGMILFIAVAEKTESTFLDGEFSGAVIGKMSLQGDILMMIPLDVSTKPEGITSDETYFYLVTDADDRRFPSTLLRGLLF